MWKILSLLALVLAFPARGSEVFSSRLLRDPIWDDGRAEYNVYSAAEIRYAIPRETEIIHIVVKEPFNRRLRVKADGPPAIDVIKFNQVINVPTGIYSDHQMHSSFWERATGRLLKFSMSSNDSCGNTFKIGWIDGSSLRLSFHTYWDGEGDGTLKRTLPADLVFYDELPFKLRTIGSLESAGEYSIHLFPTTIGSKLGKPESTPALIRVAPSSDGDVRVEVRHSGGVEEFLFDRSFPHVLKSWKKADGSSLRLRKTQRLDYWNHSRPGDEKLLR
jgi:hypothetical protein